MSLEAIRATCLALLGVALACAPTGSGDDESDVQAEFGLFYGGQIQHRQELPLELDRTRQLQGFRLRRKPPLDPTLTVRWELGKAGAGRPQKDSRGRKAAARRVQLGEAQWRPGEAVFEQSLPFAPGDPPGLWNLRVRCGDRLVLDQPFVVFDPRQREREQRALGDAG
ncbi:MAG: hypothetical protein ABI895_28185 [Deltaproteobacteria bacterium]